MTATAVKSFIFLCLTISGILVELTELFLSDRKRRKSAKTFEETFAFYTYSHDFVVARRVKERKKEIM